MSEVLVYGASDDLIEVRSEEYEDEFYLGNGDSGTVLLVGNSGALVEVKCTYDYDWGVSAKIVRPGPRGKEVVVSTVLRPDRPEDSEDQAAKVGFPGGFFKAYYLGGDE